MGAWIGVLQLGLRRKVMLLFRQKKEWTNGLVEVEGDMSGVLGNANNFVFTLRSDLVLTELFSHRILILEKLPRKRLIDDCDVARSRRVLLGNSTASKDRIADDVKVSRRDSIPESENVIVGSRSRVSINPNRTAPIVAAEG